MHYTIDLGSECNNALYSVDIKAELQKDLSGFQ